MRGERLDDRLQPPGLHEAPRGVDTFQLRHFTGRPHSLNTCREIEHGRNTTEGLHAEEGIYGSERSGQEHAETFARLGLAGDSAAGMKARAIRSR